MDRILVIGCPGSGKSTFARKLSSRTGIPLYYLDRLWHKPDKTNVTREEFDAGLDEILGKDRWIIDGNYMRTLAARLQHCDTVYFPDLPVEVCLSGAEARIGACRGDLPWVEQEMDAVFRRWVLDFPKDQVPGIYALLDTYGEGKRIFIFKTRNEMDTCLASALDC